MFEFKNKITSNSNIYSGKPCIAGTSIPVHIILDLIVGGET